MARKRDLRPSFFTNEYLAELPFEARLLFAGLWTIADRRGRLEDRPIRIKGALFPYDNMDVDRLLQMLADSEDQFVIRYSANGKRYIQITNFEKNQHVHKDETESTIPPPCENDYDNASTKSSIDANTTEAPLSIDASTSEAPPLSGASTNVAPHEHHANTPRSLELGACSLEPLASSVVVNDNNARKRTRDRDESAELFGVFWSHYPRKVAKQDAIKAWQKLKPDKETAQRMILAVKAQSKTTQWTRDSGQYIPYAATWLNGRRWEDGTGPPEKPPAQPIDPSINPFQRRGG